ncbi:hypothetical protein EDB80DRAFT_749112 [Ilyonectria destructans]|nr:hypothetical protein EDB80DRAFT_749112 [Ilyonectria destructans]
MRAAKSYIILGAGVVGLTTALELKQREPLAKIAILAREIPGDAAPTYASPWAGANWVSSATDNGPQEEWDRITCLMFKQLSQNHTEYGIKKMHLKSIYNDDISKVNILSEHTGKVWYDSLVGGIRHLEHRQLPEGAIFRFKISTFVINVQKYLPWYETLPLGGLRAITDDISDIPKRFPSVSAIFNCTGLGAFSLGRVEDTNVYPAKGQTYLVEAPLGGISKISFRSEIGEGIKKRCCALVPESGKPEDLRILKQGVGLRRSRKGGAQIEKERKNGTTVIHNYGAGGAGYQASWGIAKAAVDLLFPTAML